ncbi:MAG: ATP-binding cassette domain-containing protein [Gammaproteobacteria bacterium]|nr:ATP-binding cassette domain-containing protein [Gammaproteobacteria bacterium]
MLDAAAVLDFGKVTDRSSSLLPLEIEALCYQVGERRLIDRLDLRVDAGPVTVVMGANGAGKSLLLRLMHGILTSSSGRITWGGRELDQDVRRRQALVFQRPVLLRRSVAANIDFVLRQRGTGSRERRQQLLACAGLAHLAKQAARALSGGEQQRLALVRALAIEPAVLLLDEPTANLDPAATAAIEQIVRDVHRSGTKIIFVTHDLGQARRLADEVVFLHRGQVVEQTPAERFFDQPRSSQARDYLAGRIVI